MLTKQTYFMSYPANTFNLPQSSHACLFETTPLQTTCQRIIDFLVHVIVNNIISEAAVAVTAG